jgi:FlaA1/EpsC-like NDP-sugar epimerase
MQIELIFLSKIRSLKRLTKQLIMAIFDSIALVLVLLVSFSLTLNKWNWPEEELFLLIFGAPLIALPIFFSFKMYQSIIRYIGFDSLFTIAQAVTLYAVVWGLASLMSNHPYMMFILGVDSDPFSFRGIYFEGVSRSVIFINWMISLIVIGGSRLFARWVFKDNIFHNSQVKRNVIIYGAGVSGRQLSQVLKTSIGYKNVAYIDDDLAKDKTYIDNIPVYSFAAIDELISKNNVTEVLLALPSTPKKVRNAIIEKLSRYSIHVRSLPSVSKLAEGKLKVDDLLEIDINDLLHREPVKPNGMLLKTKVTDKVVLVTGAGGSIGSELCRQIISLQPKRLVLYEISESSLYHIEQELIGVNKSNLEVVPVLGSVNDSKRINKILAYYNVQTIYHSAAYKHVPLVEFNQTQGVLNNSIGTLSLAKASISQKVETFVLISTDKAVRPTSTMGATKRVAELILQALSLQDHTTCFTMVRFGNVLDSSGSVIPLFKKQIKTGGPVTVTDVNMVRYFMTIPEAVQLVIQAGAMGEGGDVFVLNMGKPVKIYDLAVKMIQLSGLQVLDKNNTDGDIEISYTGLRPGEKLYEELLVGNEVTKTDHNMILRAKEEMILWDKLKPMLDDLELLAVDSSRHDQVKALLKKIVPQFHNNSNQVNDQI